MNQDNDVPASVLIRDVVIFYIKLGIDGLKGLVLVQAGILAFCIDLLTRMLGLRMRTKLFYRLMELGERLDLWLNLYGAAHGRTAEGLFGGSRAGDPTFIGGIEELVKRRREAPEAAPVGVGGAPRSAGAGARGVR